MRNKYLSSSILSLKFIVVIFCLITGLQNSFATTYYQRESGPWNSSYTWTTTNLWPYQENKGTYPKAGDSVCISQNYNYATITLTENAECAYLYFSGSDPSCVLDLGDFDLVTGIWQTYYSSNVTLLQGTGYLQVNDNVPEFYTSFTIKNFRIGSSTFSFVKNSSTKTLTITDSYDFNGYQSDIPVGIVATSATKLNQTPCSPTLISTTLASFGGLCLSTTSAPKSFVVRGVALTGSALTVAALDGFTYSKTIDGVYTNTLDLTATDGRILQTVYVKFTPTVTNSYKGNIIVSGGGAIVNVAVTGSGSSSVSPTVASSMYENVSLTSTRLNGNITIAGCTSNDVSERGFYYSTTKGFADGEGVKVSETGTFDIGSFSMLVTGLTASSTYYYKVFAKNSNGTSYSSQATFNNIPVTYWSRSTGDWTSPRTWTSDGLVRKANNYTYPSAIDSVKLGNAHIVTIDKAGLACMNLDMTDYNANLVLNYDFTVNGNLKLIKGSIITANDKNFTIKGDFSNTETNSTSTSRIVYSSGDIKIGGNIYVGKKEKEKEPFECSGAGWLIMAGDYKTFTIDGGWSDVNVSRLKQTNTGFTFTTNKFILNITNQFDQNCGPVATDGVTILLPAKTLNNGGCSVTRLFKSKASGDWNSTSTWSQSHNGGTTWRDAFNTPFSGDGKVVISAGHTVSLAKAETVSRLDVNGTLDTKIFQLTGTNTLNVAAGAVLFINGTTNFPTGFPTVVLDPKTIVNYSMAGPQTILNRNYPNLTISGSDVKSIAGQLIVDELNVNSGVLQLNAGAQLTVSTSMSNNGIINLLSSAKSGTATILTPMVIAGNGFGTSSVQQYLNSARNWYISSPVNNAKTLEGFTFYKYDESENKWPVVPSRSSMETAVGYIVQAPSETTITITGTSLVTGDITKTGLSRTNGVSKAGFNLVGNPYPSYLDWTNLISHSTNLGNTMWYRTVNKSSKYVFDTFNNGVGTNNTGKGAVSKFIPPMQAFWVKLKDGKSSATLALTNSMRTHSSVSNPLKAPSTLSNGRKLVRLQVSNNQNSDEAILATNPEASNGLDMFDSDKMFNNNADIPEIYFKLNDNKLVINGLNDIPLDTEMTLGFSTLAEGDSVYSLMVTEMTNINPDLQFVVRDYSDPINVIETALKDSIVYDFVSGKVTTENRFTVMLKSGSITTNNDQTQKNVLVYCNENNQISVKCSSGDYQAVSVYSNLGIKLVEKKIYRNRTIIDTPLIAGVYLVVVSDSKTKITKKIVLY